MGVVEAFLIFSVAAFHLTVVPKRVRPDEFMANTFACQCRIKERRDIAFAIGEAVGEFNPVIGLHTRSLFLALRTRQSLFQ